MFLVKMLIFTVPGNFPDKALPEQQDSGALLTVSWAAEKKPPGLTLSPGWQDTVFGHSVPSLTLGRMVEHLDWNLNT